MNALVVGGSLYPGIADVVRAAAERADLIVAADAGASACLQAGCAPDVLVGDLDSLDPMLARQLASDGIPILRAPAEKDESDLDLALDVARSRGADSVVVVGATGGRLDHTLVALGSIARSADLRPMLQDASIEAWILDCRGRATLVLDRPGATVSLVPLVDATVSCSGMRYPLAREGLDALASRGLSNVQIDDEATVEVHTGTVLAIRMGVVE